MLLEIQRELEEQQVWLTTAQAGFPTTPVEDEVSSVRDLQLGRRTARHLHSEISAFLKRLQDKIDSQKRSPSLEEFRALELEREWGIRDIYRDMVERDREIEIQEDIAWELNHPR